MSKNFIGLTIAVLAMTFIFLVGGTSYKVDEGNSLEKIVMGTNGIVLPIKWGDIGLQMVESGVIDKGKFESLYIEDEELIAEVKNLLNRTDNGNLKITRENSGMILNLLWAFGLGNKNEILEQGPMIKYNDAGVFASTGGWTLARGKAMNHYSSYSFIALTKEEQKLVEEVSKNIYRPCCNNPTYFPDCNHGMAMLGLLELMAAQGLSEEEMYSVALQVNSYWFPDTYLTIAKYLEEEGISWSKINTKELLGYEYSSAYGYRKVLTKVSPPENQSGGSCGV